MSPETAAVALAADPAVALAVDPAVDLAVDRAAALAARLRAALVLDAPDAPAVDMSAAGVTARLREAADMASLCLALGRVGEGLGRPPG